MRYRDITSIKELYFTPKNIAKVLGISYASAVVSCSRYVKSGILLRIKRGLYALQERWRALVYPETFLIANILEVPSYISLTTALSFYEITTQIQRDFFESISLKRTKEINLGEKTFIFKKINQDLYRGFKRINGCFIATPEKALLDAIYLSSINKYSLDISALDIERIDKKKIKTLIKKYPRKTLEYWRKYVGSI